MTNPAAAAEWRHAFDEFTADSLPVLETTLRPFGGFRIPVVRVDAGDRPDVRDLLRVLRQEQTLDGLQEGGWGVAASGGRVWLVLRADVVRPARCPIGLVFDYDRPVDRTFLEAAGRSNLLGVAVEPFRYRSGKMVTPSIGLTYSGAQLGELLVAVAWGREMRAGSRKRGRAVGGGP